MHRWLLKLVAKILATNFGFTPDCCTYKEGIQQLTLFILQLEMYEHVTNDCQKNVFCGDTGKSWDQLWCSTYRTSFADDAAKKKLSKTDFNGNHKAKSPTVRKI